MWAFISRLFRRSEPSPVADVAATPKPVVKRASTWVAIVTSMLVVSEGVRQVAYRDPVGIPTVCIGETLNVKMGDRHTLAECKDMLATRLVRDFGPAVDRCVKAPMSTERKAALVSFAYNVGAGAFCKSTLVKRLNRNDPNACDELLKWTRAAGIQLPGLVKRRKEERTMCMRG